MRQAWLIVIVVALSGAAVFLDMLREEPFAAEGYEEAQVAARAGVVFLYDDCRVIPMIVSFDQSASILEVRLNQSQRPLTHDLFLEALTRYGIAIDQVRITHIDGGTFFGEIVFRKGLQRAVLDARPSDAVALAVRAGVPVLVDKRVWATAQNTCLNEKQREKIAL